MGSAWGIGNTERLQECAQASGEAISGPIVSKTCTLIRVAEFDGDSVSFIRKTSAAALLSAALGECRHSIPQRPPYHHVAEITRTISPFGRRAS